MNNLLLSPELKAKVEAKVRECLKIAEAEYERTFDFPTIRYDIRNHIGGLAQWQKNLIRFNLILMVENEEHYLANVVPHEVAHIVNRLVNAPVPPRKKLLSHGKQWKEVMGVFGVAPAVCHEYDCSSIETRPKVKRTVEVDRVEQLMKLIDRLEDDDKARLYQELEDKLY